MAFDYAYSAKETASNKPVSEATAFSLAGAAAGYQTFVSGGLISKKSIFTAYVTDSAWQTFIGTVTDGTPDTLSQDYLIESSTGAWIDWSGEATAPIIECVSPKGAANNGGLFYDNEWVWPDFSDARTGTSWAAAYATANLIYVPRPCILDGLGAFCSTGVTGKSAKLALYQAFGGSPKNIEKDAGSVDCSVAGSKSIVGINHVVREPGLYATAIMAEDGNLKFLGNGTGDYRIANMGSATKSDDLGGITSVHHGSFADTTSSYVGGFPAVFNHTGYRRSNSYWCLARFKELT